jgi:hypothetical protein
VNGVIIAVFLLGVASTPIAIGLRKKLRADRESLRRHGRLGN